MFADIYALKTEKTNIGQEAASLGAAMRQFKKLTGAIATLDLSIK